MSSNTWTRLTPTNYRKANMAQKKKPALRSVPDAKRAPNKPPTQEELQAELEESNFEVWEGVDLLNSANELQIKVNTYLKGVEQNWNNVVDNRKRVHANLVPGARYKSKHEYFREKKLSTPTANVHTLEVAQTIDTEIVEATASLPTLEEGE